MSFRNIRIANRGAPSNARVSLLALMASAALSPGMAWAQSAASPPPAGAATAVADVIVTARKTRERAQDVPISMSVLSGDAFTRADHRHLEDLNILTPNTDIALVNAHQTNLAIRGLGNNPNNDGLESSTGVFLDGVYLGRPGIAAQDLIDIDSIEVLRGPQGTLFGKNSTAGAVNITTDAPSFTFGAKAQLSYGNYNYQQYQGSFTGPLIDDVLAGRLTAFKTSRDGDVQDIYDGRRLNDLGREGMRGQLLYKPTSDFSVRLIADYAQEKQSTGALGVLPNLGLTPSAINAKVAATNSIIAADPNGQTTAVDGPVRTGTNQDGVSAEVNWGLSGFTLTSITAYRYWHYTSLVDQELSSANVLTAGYEVYDKQLSQELRVRFPRIGNLDTIVGLYYFNQNIHSDLETLYGSEAAAWLASTPDAQLPGSKLASLLSYNNSRWDTKASPQTDSYAIFGQSVWHVTPAFNLTFGLRGTYETKSETVSRAAPINIFTLAPIAALGSNYVAPEQTGLHDASPSYLINADYHLLPDVMLYAFLSHSEKAGGVNATVPAAGAPVSSLLVKPEAATDYELGFKTQLFSNRLVLNAGVFDTEVANYQSNNVVVINNALTTVLSNVSKVVSRGAEAEATARPIGGLLLHASVGYDDAYYGSYPNGPCPVEVTTTSTCNLTGRPIVGSPKWTANISGGYEHPIANNLVGYLRGEYGWRSGYYGYQDDSILTRAGNYGLTNLYAGARTQNGKWDLEIWGKNVANVHYVYQYFNLGSLVPGDYFAYYGDPATYGVTLRAAF